METMLSVLQMDIPSPTDDGLREEVGYRIFGIQKSSY